MLAFSRVLCGALVAAHAAAQFEVGSVTLTAGVYAFVPGTKVPGAVAVGSVTPMNSSISGFGDLSISTAASFTDAEQMYAAGYLEGALTADQIFLHSINIRAWIASNFGGQPPPQKYANFFNAQDAWSRSQVAANSSQRWQGVGLLLSQFDGLRAGYAAVAPAGQAVDEYTFQQMNAIGDLLDLIPALEAADSPLVKPWLWEEQTPAAIMDRARKTQHCSGLFSVTGNFSDLFWGHSAWFTYMGTNRIMKHYNFALGSGTGTHQISFSSYPSYLSSLDDYYTVWSTKLVMVETTNGIYNMSLYKLVKPESLWAWQRVRLANLLATDGPTWGDILAFENSGTYNNAYSVLDLNLFSPGEGNNSNSSPLLLSLGGRRAAAARPADNPPPPSPPPRSSPSQPPHVCGTDPRPCLLRRRHARTREGPHAHVQRA